MDTYKTKALQYLEGRKTMFRNNSERHPDEDVRASNTIKVKLMELIIEDLSRIPEHNNPCRAKTCNEPVYHLDLCERHYNMLLDS